MKFRNFCVVLPILIALFVKPVLADEGMTRAQFVAAAIFDLGYGDLAAQVVNFENMPFYDVEHYKGYIIIAYHIGIINGIGDGLFAPDAPITTEQAAIIQSRIETRLAAPLHFVHGFYAFGAFAQRHLIPDMDAVSFGWSALEWDGAGGLRLNTGALGGNPWVIPDGYELIANKPREYEAAAHLNVFMDTGMGLAEMLADPDARSYAVALILDEATRIYRAIGRSPFDGVTINFEGLRGEAARADFNAFLESLSEALRNEGLALFVTVHPATIDGIYFDGYDLRTIGRLADKVILMAHDYHPRSLEGFVGTAWQRNAALTPLAQVYRALAAITDPLTGVEDKSKIALAFSFANIGWFVDAYNNAVSPTPISVSMETVLRRMGQPDTYFGWSETFRNHYIIYTTENDERVFLWYENYESVYEKLRLARLFGVTGASVWRMGMIPNDEIWDVWPNFSRLD